MSATLLSRLTFSRLRDKPSSRGERRTQYRSGFVTVAFVPSKNCPSPVEPPGIEYHANHSKRVETPLSSHRQTVLVDLEVTNSGPQYRCRDPERTGAAQHVAEYLFALGARAGLEIA